MNSSKQLKNTLTQIYDTAINNPQARDLARQGLDLINQDSDTEPTANNCICVSREELREIIKEIVVAELDSSPFAGLGDK